ncbi:MAG: dihydroneopterin aldolase family protein [Methanomassiliicoccaceae archaeon]|nr:dihydroneopterin aldolase family protein [Methanomassiliicoccaceae archaeon]
MMDRESLAASRFDCSVRERALFEAGIKMGTIYHQFVGTPVDKNGVETLEAAMVKSICSQPYVESASIHIDRSVFDRSLDRYSYFSLTGEKIDAVVRIKIHGVSVTAEMRYDPEIGYPLMFVSNIEEQPQP